MRAWVRVVTCPSTRPYIERPGGRARRGPGGPCSDGHQSASARGRRHDPARRPSPRPAPRSSPRSCSRRARPLDRARDQRRPQGRRPDVHRRPRCASSPSRAIEFVLMRLQLIVPENTLIEPEIFNRLLSAFGVTRRDPVRAPARARADRLHRAAPDRRPRGRASRASTSSRSGSTWPAAVTSTPASSTRPPRPGVAALPPLSDARLLAADGVDAWIVGVGARDARLRLLRDQPGRHAAQACARPGMAWRRMPLFIWAAR